MDIVYLHSPITYSIARQLQRGEIARAAGGMRTRHGWDAFASVIDDGIWDLARTVAFLDAMVAALPATFTPLPSAHTGYLLACMQHQAAAAGSVCYLEEGNTSCNPCWRRRHRCHRRCHRAAACCKPDPC
jgi:hypothetical protein